MLEPLKSVEAAEPTQPDLGADVPPVSTEQLEPQTAERLIEDLRRDLQGRDDFIATAGHELRNPMSAILLQVGNLRLHARRDGAVPAWMHARLEALERHARHFVRRATALLDASRAASGAVHLCREQTDLGPLVAEVVDEFRAEAARAGCELTLDSAPDVAGLWDRAAVESIAYNLLSNAIKYGAGKPVSVAVRSAPGLALLAVRDRGIGVAPEDRRRIFERFERSDARPDRPGFGVGLWVARQFALAHGGDIALESVPGGGSTFTASLPRGI